MPQQKYLHAITLLNSAVVGAEFSTILPTDLPDSGVVAGTYTYATVTVDAFGRVTAAASGATPGTVTSVNLTAPAAGITVSGGPVTAAGSITLALADDLAALEALAGTGTIYYRSGVSTWSAVTIGSGLTFAAGTLAASGGGSPAGADKDVQINSSGAFGADTGIFTYDSAGHLLVVNNGGSLCQMGPGTFLASTSGYSVSLNGGSAGNFQDGTNQATLADGSFSAVRANTGHVTAAGTAGNTFRWQNTTAAPSTQTLLTLPLNVYGQGTITDLLGDPDAWLLVSVAGTDYKVPAYLA